MYVPRYYSPSSFGFDAFFCVIWCGEAGCQASWLALWVCISACENDIDVVGDMLKRRPQRMTKSDLFGELPSYKMNK